MFTHKHCHILTHIVSWLLAQAKEEYEKAQYNRSTDPLESTMKRDREWADKRVEGLSVDRRRAGERLLP